MSKRIYSQQEVATIIRRAVELEAERSVNREKDSREGLSISELEQIAAESGIDPELVHEAVHELSKNRPETDGLKKEKASIKRDEIVSERWLDIELHDRILDDMVTELNHRYGTSDQDITWWDNLWNSYDGKAKVRKSSNSLEWQYTDELGYFTTRVLLQSRGEKFRIRVSKRQLWGMEWNTGKNDYIYPAVFFPLFIALGGVLSFSFLDTAWPGIAGGAVLATLIYPVIKYFGKRSLQKHQNEVTETANTLTDLALQLLREPVASSSSREKKSDFDNEIVIPIEIIDDEENVNSGSLRNNLRE
jgi:hypothetical protein